MERVQLQVERLVWDTYNVPKIEAHGLSLEDVESVANSQPRFFTNFPGRSAAHVMLGPDGSNRFIFAVIVPSTDGEDSWYVVTAFRMERRRALRIYERG